MRPIVAIIILALAGPAFAYHPLLTEDTETQGKGGHQLEFSLDATRDRAGPASTRIRQTNLVLTYGLAEKLDIQLGMNRLRQRLDDGMGQIVEASGTGDTSLELKWQFVNKDGFTLALKPGITLASGDANRRLGQGHANYGGVLVAGYESDGWEFYGHLGARRNQNAFGERRSLYQASGSVLWEVRKLVWLIAEAGVLRQPDPALTRNPKFLGLAVIWGRSEKLDFDIGWRRGLNREAPDRTLGAGVTVRW
jgi:hypothetical protein